MALEPEEGIIDLSYLTLSEKENIKQVITRDVKLNKETLW